MHRLIGIQLHNFFQYEEVILDFSDIKPGSVIYVDGINHDATDARSNYAGKSTLMIDAFRWVIKGKYKRLKAAKDVVGKFDKCTYVKLIYMVDGSRCVVARGVS